MQPGTLLRTSLSAFRPSSLLFPSTAVSTTPTFRSAGWSIISGSSQITRRAASTTTTSTTTEQQQQPEQQSPLAQPSSTIPPNLDLSPDSPAAPPSLRKYPYTVRRGTVVSVGKMERTVRVVHRHTVWDDHIRKSYPKLTTYMVSDPRNSLREGDVIEFSSGAPKSRRVRHVVERIIAPFGTAIEDRPPVMTREEREAERAAKRIAKLQRREQRRIEEGKGEGVKDHVGRIRRLVLERAGEEKKNEKQVEVEKK